MIQNFTTCLTRFAPTHVYVHVQVRTKYNFPRHFTINYRSTHSTGHEDKIQLRPVWRNQRLAAHSQLQRKAFFTWRNARNVKKRPNCVLHCHNVAMSDLTWARTNTIVITGTSPFNWCKRAKPEAPIQVAPHRRKFGDVVTNWLQSGWEVAAGPHVFLDFCSICLKFAMKCVLLLQEKAVCLLN